MPPKNNFSAELKWLLSAKPFVPPAAPLVAYDPDAPSSSATISQPSSFTVELPVPNDDPAPAPALTPALPLTQPVPQFPRTRTVDIHKLPTEQAGAPQMARLAATPANNKPRLMVAGLLAKNAQPPFASRTEGNGSARRDSSSSITSIPESSTSRKQRAQTQDIEAIDLTDGLGRRSPSKSHGRKRKSDEFEADLKRKSPPRQSRTIPASSPSTDYDGFVNIDDMMTSVPESPPPPYSTTVMDRRILQIDEEDIDMDAVAEPIPSTRKRKPLSRAPSVTS